MLRVLEMPYLKILKNILQSNIFLLILIISVFCALFLNNLEKKSKLSKERNQ